ncbi:DUF262 domain-containing protein [Rhizobium sp. S153]|uniref:DUF262 domain-containing protein n=1 Tax=Ciceribacter sichuanensis TaxID=2949647 RepID=A0ABT0V6Z2_9HYPH|nr:DUF262 domain-containing protein [Ciceribacter sp. S153]MCM2401423.1 DUF262 domain-containing protein [Ciceribacter sp. S153]
MKFDPKTMKVGELVQLRKAGMLHVNQEYQRGQVWSRVQQQKLVDSLLRGYPIPLLYFHFKKQEAAGLISQRYEIIDGQQRLDAIYQFSEGAWPLLDPVKDDKKAKFPKFLKEQPCPWAGRSISDLNADMQRAFLDLELPVAIVETEQENEVRDLFVRLQSGLPLNAQETRDSWPGEFTDFILWLGGKPSIARYPGHRFFRATLGMKPEGDRGTTRQLAAQLSMVQMHRRENKYREFPDISSQAITDFYYEHVDFDRTGEEAKRLVQILDMLADNLAGWSGPKLHGHDAIHLVALADDLWDDYTPSWRDRLPEAFDNFQKGLIDGKKSKDSANPSEYWMRYGQWTRTNSDKGERIEIRHRFYVEKMIDWLRPEPKDKQRLYGDLDRALVYYSRNRKCDECGSKVLWKDAEIHHITPHYAGGSTTVENAALVHKECHPKGTKAEADFAAKFVKQKTLGQELEIILDL